MIASLASLLAFAALASAQTMAGLANATKLFPPGPQANSPLLKIISAPGYKVSILEDPHFPNRTLYIPQNTNQTLPIFAFENGICYKYGRFYATFLTEIASQGYFVVAPGKPNVLDKGMTTAAWQMESIDMASSWTNTPVKINSKKIAVGGHSCGGMESLKNLAADKDHRLTTGLILNSGGKNAQYDNITVPLLFITGGEKDVAGPPTETNFKYIEKNLKALPAFKAVLETGHLGSYWGPRGGIYAETVVHWLDWQLKDKPRAGSYFKGGQSSPAAARGWKVESHAIDALISKRAFGARSMKSRSGISGL